MMEDLDKLIAAVEGGTANQGNFLDAFGTPCQDFMYEAVRENSWRSYRGSLDAAKALHEVLLPDHWISEMRSKCGPSGENYYTEISKRVGKKVYAWGEISTVHSRSWLIAILKAHRHNLANGAAQ